MKRKAENKTKKNTKTVVSTAPKKASFFEGKPILQLTLKSLLLTAILVAGVLYSDSKGYFNPDETNNHTKRKWDSFYEFSKKNNVDVLLIGNSHLYTGINPKNVATHLGVNSFLLASPGTGVADAYYAFEEAINHCKPKVVVLETYSINDSKPYELKKGRLSSQFKSFYARKGFFNKLKSMPFLFKSDNYVYSWSNTIRNHGFIFKDPEQLEKNKLILKNKSKRQPKKKLYLGRYVRFTTGIEKDILAKYKSEGASVKGKEYKVNITTEKYVAKFVTLCKKNDIKLVFLTLPMYEKHIANYAIWKATLGTILNQHDVPWLDFQSPYDASRFSTNSFENTYAANQHMTYQGSLTATYKLTDFIKNEMKVDLPNRKTETKWKSLFYGDEGFFENNTVAPNDKRNKLVSQSFKGENIQIKEVLAIQEGANKTIIAKIDRKAYSNDFSKCKLTLAVTYKNGTVMQVANLNLNYDILHESDEVAIFKTTLKPIDLVGLQNAVVTFN